MVQRGGFGQCHRMPETYPPSMLNSTVEDQLEEENAPLNKKTKILESYSVNSLQLRKAQQFATGNKDLEMVPPQSLQDSLLEVPSEEPSPLGLRLRKSPSLLDLIQSTLSKKNSVSSLHATCNIGSEGRKKGRPRSTAVCGPSDKLKASNFSASLLRIGSWEFESRYEGDLVVKFYYSKLKIVWEVLIDSLKSKIEFQWSDIAALKACYHDNAPGTLEIVLARQPCFFRESNPQPLKHTTWEAITDFTEGQASKYRRHLIQCPSGMLNKHFEKLIHCDQRLNRLSQQTEIKLDSPYFDTCFSVFEDRGKYNRCRGYDHLKDGLIPNFEGFLGRLPTTTQSTSSNNEVRLSTVRAVNILPTKYSSSASAMDYYCAKNESASSKNKGLSNSSMSMSELVNDYGNCISGKTVLDKTVFESYSSLDEMAQKLFNDSQIDSILDEQSLMKRVNSFCGLIQQNESMVNDDDEKSCSDSSHDGKEENGEKQPSISRRNSYDELLVNLPKIESVPQLFNISED